MTTRSDEHTSRREVSKTLVRGTSGVVASHNVEAAEVGATVLRDGGTAIDAIVAMSFVTTVREPSMNSIGGVGVLLVHSAATDKTSCLDFYGRTPQHLTEEAFAPFLMNSEASDRGAFGWRPVAGERNERGAMAVGVPGLVAGLWELHQEHGTLPWNQLLEPSIELARSGFEPDEELVFDIASQMRNLRRFEETKRVFLPDGLVPVPGGFYPAGAIPILQPDLGSTLESIAKGGGPVFYRGDIATAMSDHVRSMGGFLSPSDLTAFEVEQGPGLRQSYRGYEILTSPGANGGITLLAMLNLAERFDLGSMDNTSGEYLHLITEIMRLAWLDRFVFIGDPEVASVPMSGLLSKQYAERRAESINFDALPSSASHGDPWQFADEGPPPGNTILRNEGTEAPNTTHLVAADAQGNFVTLTQTLGLSFGSCVIPPDTGTLLYGITAWMNPEPGWPNSIGPWKRQLGHAAPVIVLKDGKPIVAMGAPGGRRIVTAMFQAIANLVDFGMDIQTAIGEPRLHKEGADPTDPTGAVDPLVEVDDRMDSSSLDYLTQMGHQVVRRRESATQSFFAKPLGVASGDGHLTAGVDVFRRSLARGV